MIFVNIFTNTAISSAGTRRLGDVLRWSSKDPNVRHLQGTFRGPLGDQCKNVSSVRPRDAQIGSLGDVLGTLEGDVLGTSWGPIFVGWEGLIRQLSACHNRT